jgi:hypothetical protein
VPANIRVQRRSRIQGILALLVCSLCGGCSEERNVAKGPMPSSDVSALSRFVTLPAMPQRVMWQTVPLGRAGSPGPNDWALVALLEFDETTAHAILSRSRVTSADRSVTIPKELVLQWFPSPLKQQLKAAQDANGFTLNAVAYDASAFAKSPLVNGYIARVEGPSGHIFLVLFTI